jgi:DHA2 family multidrug resistance protein-like MFS transporter
MLTTLVVWGIYVYIAQYLQLVLGLSPLAAGLWLLPGSCGVIAGSMLAPAIVRRVQPAYVIGGGVGLAALGFAMLTRVSAFGLPGVVAATTVLYLGLGPVFTLGTDLIVSAAPPERAGAAAAISETSSELGGALGIAILGSIGTALYRRAMATADLAGIPAQAMRAARDTLGGASAAARQLPPAAGTRLLDTARAAFERSLELTAAISGVIAAAVAIVAMVMLRRIGERSPTAANAAVHRPLTASREA